MPSDGGCKEPANASAAAHANRSVLELAELAADHWDHFRDLIETQGTAFGDDSKRQMLLRQLAGQGQIDAVKLLLQHGELDVNSADQDGSTALHEAAYYQHRGTIEALLAHGAEIDLQTSETKGGETALHRVLYRPGPYDKSYFVGRPESLSPVAALIQEGANVNRRAAAFRTPLHCAADNGHAAAVKLLLNAGADPNSQDEEGNLPIHLAARKRHREILERLLKATRGIGVNASNKHGQTPLLLALNSHESVPEWRYDELSLIHVVQVLFNFGATSIARLYDRLPVLELVRREDFPYSDARRVIREHAAKETADSAFMCTIAKFAHRSSSESPTCSFPSVAEALSRSEFDPYFRREYSTPDFRSSLNWIHFPALNLSWVEEFHKQLTILRNPFTEDDYQFGFKAWLQDIQFDSVGYCNYKPRVEVRQGNFAGEKHGSFVALPYLSCDSFERYNTYNKALKDQSASRWIEKGRFAELSRTKDPEMARDAFLATAYPDLLQKGKRHTLDDFAYYPRSSSIRDSCQVTVRVTQGAPIESASVDRFRSQWWPNSDKEGEENAEGQLIMVDQMLLWTIGDDLVITCSNSPWHSVSTGLLGDIHTELAKSRVENSYHLADTIIRKLAVARTLDDEAIFKNFRSALDQTADLQLKHFKEFITASLAFDAAANKGAAALDLVRTSSDAISRTDAEIKNLCEVADIMEELEIMSSVLATQLVVVDDFKASISELSVARPEDRELKNTQSEDAKSRAAKSKILIERGQATIVDLSGRARRTHAAVQQLLDLKQKQATIVESRYARWQVEATARQSATVIVFTVVTVVFLPASFVASFLAIPNIEIPGVAQGGFRYVVGIVLAVTIALATPLVLIAFNAPEAGAFMNLAYGALVHRGLRKGGGATV